MKYGKRKSRTRSKRQAVLWNNLQIPAKLFFEIAKTGKVGLLVKDIPENEGRKIPATETVLKTWERLYDSYYERSKNPHAEAIFRKKIQVAKLGGFIALVESLLINVAVADLNPEQLAQLQAEFAKIKVHIEFTSGKLEAIKAAIEGFLSNKRTALALKQDQLKNMQNEEQAEFVQHCVAIESQGYDAPDTITLERFIAYIEAIRKKAA